MIERCSECDSLGGHKYGCTRVGASARAVEADAGERRLADVLAKWPRGLPPSPLPVPPPLLILALLIAAIYCISTEVTSGNHLLAATGPGILMSIWLWARYSRGAKSLNYIGTTIIGDHWNGGVITKWISCGFPLVPVRSFVLISPPADPEAFDLIASRTHAHDIQARYLAVPLPGLGIDWASVGATYVTAAGLFLVIAVISIILALCKSYL